MLDFSPVDATTQSIALQDLSRRCHRCRYEYHHADCISLPVIFPNIILKCTPPQKFFITHFFFHCENFFFESISKKWLKSNQKSKKSCNFYDPCFCKTSIPRFPDPSGPGNVENCQNMRKSRKSPKSPKSPKSAPPDRTHPIDHFLAALLVLIPVALREVRATPFSVAIFERFRAGGRFGKSGSSWKSRY